MPPPSKAPPVPLVPCLSVEQPPKQDQHNEQFPEKMPNCLLPVQNMFLAIINDTYTEVKADFAEIPSQEIHIKDLVRQVSKCFCNYLI